MKEDNRTANYWESKIRECLTTAGRYSSALDINIFMLANSLVRYLDLIDEMRDQNYTLVGENGAAQQHPGAKLLISTEDIILKQMKVLDLTSEGAVGHIDDDPMAGLVSDVRKAIAKR